MAQGAAKKSSNPNAGKKNAPKVNSRRVIGSKVIAPKKQKLIAQRKLAKKHSSGLIALTEKNLAEKAGHLELLGGGKKEKKAQAQAQAAGKK